MRVLVIGDSCKDVFIYGDIERISPEAPVPVFTPTHEESNDGMARNVSNNVEALGITIHTVTNKNSIVKKRYVENRSGQMVLRVDEHDYCDGISKKERNNIINKELGFGGHDDSSPRAKREAEEYANELLPRLKKRCAENSELRI